MSARGAARRSCEEADRRQGSGGGGIAGAPLPPSTTPERSTANPPLGRQPFLRAHGLIRIRAYTVPPEAGRQVLNAECGPLRAKCLSPPRRSGSSTRPEGAMYGCISLALPGKLPNVPKVTHERPRSKYQVESGLSAASADGNGDVLRS